MYAVSYVKKRGLVIELRRKGFHGAHLDRESEADALESCVDNPQFETSKAFPFSVSDRKMFTCSILLHNQERCFVSR